MRKEFIQATTRRQAVNELEALQSQDLGDDPLQPAANWLNEAIVDLTATDIQQRLSVGRDRAQRLLDHARRVDENKIPYQEGAEAKRSGATWFDCPYTDFYRQSQWLRGWDSASCIEGDGEV